MCIYSATRLPRAAAGDDGRGGVGRSGGRGQSHLLQADAQPLLRQLPLACLPCAADDAVRGAPGSATWPFRTEVIVPRGTLPPNPLLKTAHSCHACVCWAGGRSLQHGYARNRLLFRRSACLCRENTLHIPTVRAHRRLLVARTTLNVEQGGEGGRRNERGIRRFF